MRCCLFAYLFTDSLCANTQRSVTRDGSIIPEITPDFARESRGDLLRSEGVRANCGNVTAQASILTADVYNR